MIAYILTHLWVFMEMLFLDILADAFLIKKKSGSRSKRVFGLLFLTMVMSVSVTLFEDIVALKLFFDFLLVYAYLLYFYQTTLGEALSVYVINYSVIICIDFIGVSGYYYIFGTSENMPMFYLMCLMVKSTELGSGFLIRWFWKKGGNAAIRSEGIRALFPSFVIIAGAGIFASQFLMRTQTVPVEVAVLMAGMIGLNIFLVFNMLLAARVELEKNSLKDAARQTKMELLIYQNKQELYTKQGKRLHEYKNQLLTISDMLEQGMVSQTLQYTQGLTGEIGKALERIYTNHPVVDAILNMKRQEALNRGVNVNLMCGDLRDMILKEDEIIILLGNLLDNAIEAAEKCESEGMVLVRIVREKRQLVITVKNSYAGQLHLEDSRLMTSKLDEENHGYGLAAIQDIAGRYDGTFVVKAEGDYVKATVLIPDM